MSAQNIFTWSGRTQAGLGLFAASLIYLAVAAPNAVAIAFAVGAGACLALFGITGSRFGLTLLTLLMLAVSAAGPVRRAGAGQLCAAAGRARADRGGCR